jgi:hypothetical protein
MQRCDARPVVDRGALAIGSRPASCLDRVSIAPPGVQRPGRADGIVGSTSVGNMHKDSMTSPATRTPFTGRIWLLAALTAASPGAACDRPWVCDEADPARLAELPRRLSATGLYNDAAGHQLAADVAAYTPQFPLWSDGADKQRWIRLPPGRQIDTSDMDEWVFPEGTRIWKQFSVSGVRIETRLVEKRGPTDDDWVPQSYVWDAEEADAVAAPLGESDARGTGHDVPAAGECFACHAGRRSFVLGFSAIQLAQPAGPGELDLDGLIQHGQLTAPPDSAPIVPGTDIERTALGYLHANCSHCHNRARPARDGPRCFDPENRYDFSLAVGELGATADTATYRTVVGAAIEPGDPDGSDAVRLMSQRGFLRQMPPLATAKVDTAAVANLRIWIEGLP